MEGSIHIIAYPVDPAAAIHFEADAGIRSQLCSAEPELGSEVHLAVSKRLVTLDEAVTSTRSRRINLESLLPTVDLPKIV